MIGEIITIDDRQVLAHFERLPAVLRERLIARLSPVDQRMLGLVRSLEPVRTGRLRALTTGSVISGNTFVRARVIVGGQTGADFAKAGALEYGVPGLSPRSLGRAPGGWVSVKASQRRGESVRAYRRRVRIEAGRFLRRAVAAMQADGTAAIEQAVSEAIAG